jgi:hypothetical protein
LPLLYPPGDAQGDLLEEPEDDLLDDPLEDPAEYPDEDIPEKELEAGRPTASCLCGALRGWA